MLALGVFGLCQIHAFVDYLRANMTKDNFAILFRSLVIGVAGIICVGLAVLTLSGKVMMIIIIILIIMIMMIIRMMIMLMVIMIMMMLGGALDREVLLAA